MDIVKLKEIFYSEVFTEAEPGIGEDGRYHGVYVIQNQINGKLYIGKHSSDKLDDDYFGSGFALKRAITKYGKENFKMKYIHFSESAEQVHLDEDEVIGIVLEEVFDGNWTEFSKVAYNLKRNQGFNSFSDETRRRMSDAQLGKTFSDATKQKLADGRLGKTHSVESRQKMSDSLMGLLVGKKNGFFKGYSIGLNNQSIIIFCGENDMLARGFRSGDISRCIKNNSRTCKGYSFIRTLNKSDVITLLESRSFADTESLIHFNSMLDSIE